MHVDEVLIATDAWRSSFPGAVVGALVIRDVANPDRSTALETRKRELETHLRERAALLGPDGIGTDPIVRAYRDYYRRRGATYHVRAQWESVALKGRPIPSRAALVEAMFMAELEHLILTAGHDLAALELPLQVDATVEGDRYTLMNGTERPTAAGDMKMTDGHGIVSTVIHGPDARSRITPSTREVLFAVYAPPGVDQDALRPHLDGIRANVLLVAPDAQTDLLATISAP